MNKHTNYYNHPVIDLSQDATPEEEEESQEEPGMSLEEAKKESVLREKLAVSMMKKVRAQKQLISLRSKYNNILAR